MTSDERQTIATFLGQSVDELRKERKRFDAEQMRHRASELYENLIQLGTDPTTAHQYVEDALRYMALLLADWALHTEANVAGYELNVHLMESHKLLGHKWRYRAQKVSRFLTGFTHRPLRLAVFAVIVWGSCALVPFVLTQATDRPTLVYSATLSAEGPAMAPSTRERRCVPLWGYLYFSTVTITTLGYGDICMDPQHPWAVVVAFILGSEAVLGYIVLGMFIALLLKAVQPHQYARISRWAEEYEQAMLPPGSQRLYDPGWPGYV